MTRPDGEASRRLRKHARLLEFLKFRVLAAQHTFFEAWRLDAGMSFGSLTPTDSSTLPPLDLAAFRHWLEAHWPEAAGLSDADLRYGLEQAYRLYIDPPPIQRP